MRVPTVRRHATTVHKQKSAVAGCRNRTNKSHFLQSEKHPATTPPFTTPALCRTFHCIINSSVIYPQHATSMTLVLMATIHRIDLVHHVHHVIVMMLSLLLLRSLLCHHRLLML